MELGTKNKKQTIIAAVLGMVLVAIALHEFWPTSSTNASTVTTTPEVDPTATHSASRRASNTPAKKLRPQQSLDPTLHLDQLAAAEQVKYEGSGRNIFVAQADIEIPKPQSNGTIDKTAPDAVRDIYHPPTQTPSPPIPLKFFGFASQPGEPKKIFLSKGDDVFIAGEGEIIDRRYKVVKISTNSVEIQDVVLSGPPQSIPLTQANPS